MKSFALAGLLVGSLVGGCVRTTPYQRVTKTWTRETELNGSYQLVLHVAAVYKSEEWRSAYAEKDATARGLAGAARDQRIAQARADAAGPIEIEVLFTTWDRKENDLDRGKKSSWRVRMLDAAGSEVEPMDVVKDKRPLSVLRSEFPAMGDFATAYVVRFPRPTDPRDLRLRVSSERGGVEVAWASH